MIQKIHIIQHVPYEGPSLIRLWANENGFCLSFSQCWEPVCFPQSHEVDGLIVLGGPMNVGEWERYPWLLQELDCIKNFIDAKKPVLGICLGGQLLAHSLGGRITRLEHAEIGVWPVRLNKQSALMGFGEKDAQVNTAHWHSYQFDLPPKAHALMSSDACKVQGFIFEQHVIGIQCHFEADPMWMRRLCVRDSSDLIEAPFIQNLETIENKLSQLSEGYVVMEKMLNHLFKL